MEETPHLMRSARFRSEREESWKALELLVFKAETAGVRAMSFEEAKSLSELYRSTANSLATAREISLDKALLTYLEGLTARAYLSVYAPQEPVGGLVKRFFTSSAPQAMRNSWLPLFIGFFAMFLGGLTGYLLFVEDSSWYSVFMPTELAGGRHPGASTEYLRSVIYEEDPDSTGLGAFAAMLFSHNTRIAIFVFGLGAFLVAPAIMLTYYNGLILGAFVGLHVERGLGMDIFGWLSIHGVTELSAICIACAGGVKLGNAILFPGKRTRRRALSEEGRDAVKLALVAAIMLIAAALLEGFPRQLVQDTQMRLIIGWGCGALWLSWFLLAGRKR